MTPDADSGATPVDPHLLPAVLNALNHPQRLRVIAALRDERKYVSALARELKMSRPLLYLHLDHLEKAGLITGSLELSLEGKAVKWYALQPFDIHITPDLVAVVADMQTSKPDMHTSKPDHDTTQKDGNDD